MYTYAYTCYISKCYIIFNLCIIISPVTLPPIAPTAALPPQGPGGRPMQSHRRGRAGHTRRLRRPSTSRRPASFHLQKGQNIRPIGSPIKVIKLNSRIGL